LINNMCVYIGPICAVENATLFNRNSIIKKHCHDLKYRRNFINSHTEKSYFCDFGVKYNPNIS